MNKFQAMARIMAILNEDGRFKKGSRKYKIARMLASKKIDAMGPDAAYSRVKWNKYELLVDVEEYYRLEQAGKILGNFV